jgi:hypothetical protein
MLHGQASYPHHLYNEPENFNNSLYQVNSPSRYHQESRNNPHHVTPFHINSLINHHRPSYGNTLAQYQSTSSETIASRHQPQNHDRLLKNYLSPTHLSSNSRHHTHPHDVSLSRHHQESHVNLQDWDNSRRHSMSQNTINVAHTTHNNIIPLHQQNNTTRVSISNLVNLQNLLPHNAVNIYSNYQNSSNLPPLEQPRILDDLPEINLDLIENHVHHHLSQIGFENPAGAVLNDESGIDLDQTGQIAQDNFAGQIPAEISTGQLHGVGENLQVSDLTL